MGLLTLSQFRSEVQGSLGFRNIDSDRLDIWINFAYLDLASAIDFQVFEQIETSTLTGGESSIPAPPNPLSIKLVKNLSNGKSLAWVQKSEYFRLPAISAVPDTWTWHGDTLLFHPTPPTSQEIQVVYRALPGALDNEVDQTNIPALWDVAVTMLATYYGMLSIGEEQRATVWYARAVNYIQTRLTEDMIRATESGLGLSLPPIRRLDIRPFVGQTGPGAE